MLVIALHTAYLAMLLGGIGTFEQRMAIALAGYATYVINAAQFLLKLRAARARSAGSERRPAHAVIGGGGMSGDPSSPRQSPDRPFRPCCASAASARCSAG
jgi:hypothetical protein